MGSFQELTADRKAKGFNVVQIVCGPYPDDNLTLESGINILKRDVTNLLVNRFTSDERNPDDCDWLTGNYLNNWPGWFKLNNS